MFAESEGKVWMVAMILAAVMILTAIPLSSIEGNTNAEASVTREGTDGFDSSNEGKILFADNFDDGTLNKWRINGWNPEGIMESTDTVSHSAGYSAHSQSDPGTNTAPNIAVEFNETHYLSIEGYFYLPEKTQEFEAFRLFNPRYIEGGFDGWNDPDRNFNRIDIGLRDDNYNLDVWKHPSEESGNIAIANDIYQLKPETWYKTDIVIEKETFRVYLNDELIFEGKDGINASYPFNVLIMGDIGGENGCWGDAYWDDITITAISPDVDISTHDSDMTFSTEYPKASDNVTISATIHGDYDIWKNTSDSELLFSDNFDGGTLNKWYVGPYVPSGVMEATQTVSNSRNYSAHSQSDPNTDSAPYIASDFNETDNLRMETWVYLPQKTQEYDRFALLNPRYVEGGIGNPSADGTISSRTKYYINIGLIDDDYGIDIRENSTDTVYDVYTLQPETWYKLDLMIWNEQFTLSVDDQEVYRQNRTTSIPINVIFLGDGGTSTGEWGNAYWDDVTVTGYTQTRTLVHKAQNATCTVSFYMDEVSESNLIYRENNVFVPANGDVKVNATWEAVEGNHTIIVMASDVAPNDTNIENNEACMEIHVDSSETVDISTHDSDMTFSTEYPKERDNVTISATIHGDYDIWKNTSDSELLFSDNFEDGTLNKWFIGPWNPTGVMEVTGSVSNSPNYCAHSQSDPNTNTAPFIARDFNATNHLLVEDWIYIPEQTQAYDKFSILQVQALTNGLNDLPDPPYGVVGGRTTYVLKCILYDNNYNLDIYQREKSPEENTEIIPDVFEFQPARWYKLGILVDGATYQILINDSCVYEGLRYDDRPLNLTAFGDLYGDEGWGDVYMDDVTVTGYTQTRTLVHKAQNATCTVSFYMDEVSESNLIYRENNVFVPANGDVKVNATWEAVEGNHTIIVKAEDVNPSDKDHTNNVAVREIRVKPDYVDLAVSSDDISYTFNDSGCGCPCHWDTINISATIHNLGDTNAVSTISFYMDEINPEYLIYREYGVSVPAGAYTTVYHEWFVHMKNKNIEGNHTIVVSIRDSSPPESNLSNNQASIPIYIGAAQERLHIKVSTDKQKYVVGVDTEATIIVKVTSKGILISNATLTVWLTRPDESTETVSVGEKSPGIYVGTYLFKDTSPLGEYRIKAVAEKEGYVSGENQDSKDKFFLKEPGGCSVNEVSLSSVALTSSDRSITITASMDSSTDSVYAEVKKHKNSADIVLPLYDDGSHGDLSADDGIFTAILDITGFYGTYTVDIVSDQMIFENMAAFSIHNDSDQVSMETRTGLKSSGDTLHIVSDVTGVSIDLSLASDLSDISFTIVEHRISGKMRYMEIIPSENIDSALINAKLSVKYTPEDIPEDVEERDMRINVFNIYTEEWEVCDPGWVNPQDNVILAETSHFSNFSIMAAPYTYSSSAVHTGWNVFTLPWVKSPMNIEYVLYSIEWDRAMVYMNGQWYTYNKARDAKYNMGFPLVDNTMGMYVHVLSGYTLKGSYNVQISNTTLHLNKGWNLIGYPSGSDAKVSSVFSGIPWQHMESLDANGNIYALSGEDYMISGKAYWVYVEYPCDVAINW